MGYPRARKCGAKRDPRGKAPFSPIYSLVHSPASWASAIWRSLYYMVDQNRCGLCSWETCSPESKEICPTAGGIVGRESSKGENICGLSASSLTCRGLLVRWFWCQDYLLSHGQLTFLGLASPECIVESSCCLEHLFWGWVLLLSYYLAYKNKLRHNRGGKGRKIKPGFTSVVDFFFLTIEIYSKLKCLALGLIWMKKYIYIYMHTWMMSGF